MDCYFCSVLKVNWVRNDENICYYLVYKAADKFEKAHRRLPSKLHRLSMTSWWTHFNLFIYSTDSQEDRELLKQETVAVLKDMGITLGEAEEIVQSDTMDKSILN
jgi:amyloid beta precursor protein binding protein 1